MNFDDIANQQVDELKEQGYKLPYERDREKQYKQACKEFEISLSYPFER